MAETGGVTFQDVASFGVSDTGLTQYRPPDPLPLPISARDYPYQPFPLTVFALDDYLLSVSGAGLRQPTSLLVEASGPSPTFGGNKFSAPVFDLAQPNWTDTRPAGSTAPIWFYRRDGTVVHNEDIRRGNAQILAAMHLDNKPDLIRAAIAQGTVDAATVGLINEVLPEVQQRRDQRLVNALTNQAFADAMDKQSKSWRGTLDQVVSLAAFVLMATPAAPFVAVAYAAYVVGTTTEQQVKTGRVTGQQLLGETLAVAGAYGAVANITASRANAAALAAQPLPAVPTLSIQPVPLSGNPLQASFARAAGVPLTGTPALQASLLRQPIAPALSQGERLGGGILTQSIFTKAPPTLLDSVLAYVKKDPVKIAVTAKESLDFGTELAQGDLRGSLNAALGLAGVPFQVPGPSPGIHVPQVPVRPVVPGGGQGGGSMLFSSPADPASANVWPWVFGAFLLGVLVFVIRKGR